MKEASYYRSNKNMSLYGSAHHLSLHDEGAYVMEADCMEAYFVSKIFDGGECQQSWDELHLHFTDIWELNVSIWIFDDVNVKQQLASFTLEDRYHVIELNGFSSPFCDVLLYGRKQDIRGQYCVFSISLRKPKGHTITFTAFELSFPAILFSEYLPYVYQGNPDLDTYLSVFKDVYLSLEEQVDNFYEQLDPTTASEEHVKMLLKWQGFDRYMQYTSCLDLRTFPQFMNTHRYQKGTLSYLTQLVYQLFHIQVIVVWCNELLHVYVPKQITAKEHRICLFFQQEVLPEVEAQVHFITQSSYDKDAYLGITTILGASVFAFNRKAHIDACIMR